MITTKPIYNMKDFAPSRLVTDYKKLRRQCKPCLSIKEGVDIGRYLLDILKYSKSGVGLAANQVGIDSRVCVINVTIPFILINPVITSKFEKIRFREGCLSFPGDYITTERFAHVSIYDDRNKVSYFTRDKSLLESVCVQHEIDHLNGITMHDRRIITTEQQGIKL
jgi:peptide deformylase